MMTCQKNSSRITAVLAVFLMLAVLFVPISSDSDTDAAIGEMYTYTITPEGKILGDYKPIGTSSSSGSYTSTNNRNSGSWTWDEDGYGPFNSFYAAFDPAQDNRMIGHLDPDDLTKLVDGTSIEGLGYNIMWCLPTVYWKTDSSGNLILTNDPDSGGVPYAHKINNHVYRYIGIGVYEGTTETVNSKVTLLSYYPKKRPRPMLAYLDFRLVPTINWSTPMEREPTAIHWYGTSTNGNCTSIVPSLLWVPGIHKELLVTDMSIIIVQCISRLPALTINQGRMQEQREQTYLL